MKNEFLNSIRIGYENWIDEERFESIMKLLEKYPCGISQIALFTSSVHTPLKLDELKRRTEIMELRMKRIRKAGLSAGINILATIGHHEEHLENTVLGMGYKNMTDANGNVCLGSFCMNDEKYIDEYVKPAYNILSQANPDFIWVDDDIRLNHMGIESGCFCDSCVERYNKDNKTEYTRDDIRDRLYSGDIKFRLSWLRHKSDSVTDILRTIGDTVRSINEDIILGFMTGERYIEGYDFAGFAKGLSSDGKYEIMWRPGGGAYDDFNFESGIMEKADEIGRQNAYLPPYVTLIHSEIENFPYQTTKKTPKSTAAEALLHMQSGCTGAAFNILPSESDEPIESIEGHLKKINSYVPIYKNLYEATKGFEISGIHNSWHRRAQALKAKNSWPVDGKWESVGNEDVILYSKELYMNGIPNAFNIDNAEAIILSAQNTRLYSDDEILKMLGGGVYMSAETVKCLTDRGFGKYLGFKIGKEFEVDCIEKYVDAPMNEGIVGRMRNCHQAFHAGTAYELIPMGEHINLASLIDYDKKVIAECCMGIYENELGGRICVSGYFPYEWVSDISKSTQLKRVFRYITRDGLAAYVDTYARVRIINYVKDENVVTTLFNSTNDELENVEIAIRTDAQTCELCRNDGKIETVTCKETDGVYKIFEIDKLGAFDFCYLKTK